MRIAITTFGCMAAALFAPWEWMTWIVVLSAPILIGLWLVASLTGDRLRVLPRPGEDRPDLHSPSNLDLAVAQSARSDDGGIDQP